MTNLIIAGLGYGNSQLITCAAVHALEEAEVVLMPRAKSDEPGIAENIITSMNVMKDIKFIPVTFPMTRASSCAIVREQLQGVIDELTGRTIIFPTIGDCMLYSTAYYLIEAVKPLIPDIEIRFIPGVSAHSIAASLTQTFLAMSDEILTVIPGTASPSRISSALEAADTAVIYKPSAIHDIHSLIDAEKFSHIILATHAGDSERQRIITGNNALDDIREYMSILLLKR